MMHEIVRPQAMRICNDACTLDITGLQCGLMARVMKKSSYVQLSLDLKSMRVGD